MKKIYLAARYERLSELSEYREKLQSLGYIVTSRWLNGEHICESAKPEMIADLNRDYAEIDLLDIDRSDTVILFTDKPKTVLKGGGMFVELGYAIACSKNIVIVGPRENIFCFLDNIDYQFDTWGEFLNAISEVAFT